MNILKSPESKSLISHLFNLISKFLIYYFMPLVNMYTTASSRIIIIDITGV